MSYQKQLLASTKSKYFKFKNRLERNITSGNFDSLPRKKKNGLISKVEKFRARLERLSLARPGAMVGSALSAAAIPNFANAQNPNFYLQNDGSVTASGARDVVVANIDSDPDLEVILATNTGGIIANFDGKDGYTNSEPSSLDNALLFIMVGDIDGDNDLDLIFGDESDETYFYKAINDGNGVFTTSHIADLSVSSDTDLVDWDSDGDLDIILSSYGSSFEVLENDGAGTFTELPAVPLTIDGVRDIEFADLDNDGDLDMLLVSYQGSVPYQGSVLAFENTTDGPGTPTFDLLSPSIVRQQNYTRFDDIVPLDFDGDGDLDLFFERQNSSYGYGSLNNFVEGTPFAFTNVGVSYLGSGGGISAAAVADFDADGDDDLILAGSNFNRLLRFNGTILSSQDGNLGGEIGNVYGDFDNIYVADLTGDDHLDLIGVDPAAASAEIFRDDSAPFIGEFYGTAIMDENSPVGSRFGMLTFSDLQGDPVSATMVGDDASFFLLDEVSGELTLNAELDWESIGSDLLFEVELSDGVKSRVQEGIFKVVNLAEEGNGTFSEAPLRVFGMREVQQFTPGDYDLDGDTDLFVSSEDPALVNSVLQQNSGSFTDELISTFTQYQREATFINGNGNLNLLVHDNVNDELRLMDQNSNGFTSYETLLTGILSVENIVVGDFDGDQSIEAVVHVENSLNVEMIYTFEDVDGDLIQSQSFTINDPNTGAGLLDGIGEMDRIAVADFDNDGFGDLLAVTTGGDDVLFSGGFDLGAGAYGFESTFTTVITQDDGGESKVQVGDIDGDGSEDIAIMRWVDNTAYALMLDLHTNDGSGNFTLDQTIDLGGEYASDIALADIDGDSDLDIVATSLQLDDVGGEFILTTDLKTYLNDGTGSFTAFQTIEEIGGEDFKMMDVDGDDDLDIVVKYGFSGAESEDQLVVYENVNVSPTAINLSQSSMDEHLDLDSQVGTITIDDLNPGDTHTLSFAEGNGSNDEHNSFFSLDGNILRIVKDVRREDTPSLRILISVYDGENIFEQDFTLSVNDVNLAPTAISLSATAFDEGTQPGTEIATVSAIDPNVPDEHVFELAVGDGINDADNGLFILDGDKLYIASESSFETKPTYNIFLSATDIDNTFEQAFVLTVNDINQAPTGITLSSNSFDEGTTPGSTIATLTAVDANIGDTHVFSLTTGDGVNDSDNASFVIEGSNLRIMETSSFEAKPSYNIHLTVADNEGSFDQAFTITVNDINQAPTGITLSASSFDEGTVPGSTIATLTAVDANAGDVHTFSLATGDGTNDVDNASFVIDGSSLKITEASSFETKASYNIFLTVADAQGSFSQAFTIDVIDVNQAPTGVTFSAISFDEGTAPGSVVAVLSAVDANAGDAHTFELTSGDGTNDADNSAFILNGNNLIVVEESNFETKANYNIHLTVSDDQGSFSEGYLVGVNDVNQAPTAVVLSSTIIDEGTPAGVSIASISVTDPNAGDSHEITLATGDGTNDEHNDLFLINGNDLILIGNINFDLTQTLNIHLSANDGYQTFEQAFELTVNEVLGFDGDADKLAVFPNPGADRLEVSLVNDFRGTMEVNVLDLAGRTIHSMGIQKRTNSWSHTLDMTEEKAGVYLVKISFKDELLVTRWVKR